ncbi:MFS multidrug transporter [Emericellopsis atlantica]|uniref:MFS multidrug transporter n=1 Tax=Emericellopsis atlantica TaxID=2614577 RepID=A0A9P8CRK0_9HYPO|nr:MFS multidrug transporter [Emericellopsis atlantica]KAG9254806.1 MFS multidrug transporter [Emericellopsis atlantica]
MESSVSSYPELKSPQATVSSRGSSGTRILTEAECSEQLGYSFSTTKKWLILTVAFWVQISMNFNASVYNNATSGMQAEFGVKEIYAKLGSALFLIMYAFGCELWAPWSEELGRHCVMQASMGLVNIWQLPVALAPNMASVIAGRVLGGLSTAGGSVTLGMVADMWDADSQQYAVAYVVFSSVAGSIMGPIVGGFLETHFNWRWCIWAQIILGLAVQLAHWFTPETRSTVIVNKIAKQRRKANPADDVWGPSEDKSLRDRFSWKQIRDVWMRGFIMLFTDPIVACLSALSGFADALIFMCIHSFGIVYGHIWGFNAWQTGLTFVSILVSYFFSWMLFIPSFGRNKRLRTAKPDDERTQFESRLWPLLWQGPLLCLGLIGFALTLRSDIHWIASLVFAVLVGMSNYAIYMATIDYMICAYGPYSASATGGNGWARDILAGILVFAAKPFFTDIGNDEVKSYMWAGVILFLLSLPLVGFVFVIYVKGPALRKRSTFAQGLEDSRLAMAGAPVGHGVVA